MYPRGKETTYVGAEDKFIFGALDADGRYPWRRRVVEKAGAVIRECGGPNLVTVWSIVIGDRSSSPIHQSVLARLDLGAVLILCYSYTIACVPPVPLWPALS